MHFQFRLPGFSLGIARLLGWSISFGLAACGGGEGQAGYRGPAGADGADGANGVNGTNGANGANGTGILTGAGVPASDVGVVGDLYLDSVSTTLYGPKTDAGWPASGVSLKGAQGDKGDPGDAGASVDRPAVFVARFVARAGGPGEFYVPISGDGDSALEGDYALATRYEPNATTMPVHCGVGGLYVNATLVSEPYDPYEIDADGTSIDVTLVKNEVATDLHAALEVNVRHPSASVSSLPSTTDVTVMPGDTLALRIAPAIPNVSVAMNVSLACR